MAKKCILLLLLAGQLLSAESSEDADTEQIENHRDRNFGIEISPIFLILSEKDDLNIKGAFSLFNISKRLELAFPFEYISRKDKEMLYYGFLADYNRFTIDCIPRLFLKNEQGGFYFSAGLRYTYEYGIDEDLNRVTPENKYNSNKKLGVSFGIGYRYFSPIGFYWGASLFGGKYFTDNKIIIDNLTGTSMEPDLFFMIELLKFGYAF
jgi:hypothetical protein